MRKIGAQGQGAYRVTERRLLPHICRSQYPSGSAQLGGYLPLAPGGFYRPLSDPRADLRLRFHVSERDGRNVP